MKRRELTLMSVWGLAALNAGLAMPKKAFAGVSEGQAAALKTTLTPFGAERAGSADGSIPAWAGGETTIPAGWTPDQQMPDLYANDQKILSINAPNMAQYKDRLTDGVVAMMTKFPDFRIDVYPTHRSAAAPQWVYDNTYKNALNAQLSSQGARFGFSNAYGGYPFPILDPAPLVAGAQAMWNHSCRWNGITLIDVDAAYVMSNGVLTLASGYNNDQDFPYYLPNGSVASYSGFEKRNFDGFIAPANIDGQELVLWQPTNFSGENTQAWQYLNGQGRVRKAPELEYDTPATATDDVANYDEYLGFLGGLDRYDWKLLGKKEMYIPYNSNKLALVTAQSAHLPHCLNPDYVRWELHRVWVIDATLHPGARHVEPHRRFYLDEDTWAVILSDAWDAQGNLWKVNMQYTLVRPDVPGDIYGNSAVYDLQANEYATLGGPWANPPYNKAIDTQVRVPPGQYNPQSMGAQAQY
jgi:hypothetical protein